MFVSKHTLVIGGIAGTLFIASVVALAIFMHIISNSNTVLHEKKLERQKNQLHQQELSTLVKLVEETTEEREETLSYILREDEVIDFLALIEMLGREQQVTLKTDSLDVLPVDALVEKLQVKVSISGPFNSVMHTLALFETLPYQSYISNISLVRGETGIDDWKSDFTLQVTKLKDS